MAASHIVASHYVLNIMVPVDPPAFLGPWIYMALLRGCREDVVTSSIPSHSDPSARAGSAQDQHNNFPIPPMDGVAASMRRLVHFWQEPWLQAECFRWHHYGPQGVWVVALFPCQCQRLQVAGLSGDCGTDQGPQVIAGPGGRSDLDGPCGQPDA